MDSLFLCNFALIIRTSRNMNIKAVLFDLDGVLIDTEGIYSCFWNEMDSLYPTGVADFANVIKGNTLSNILNKYFPDKEIQENIKRRLVKQENEMDYRLYDGAVALMSELRHKGIKTAIVTSSNLKKMKHLFTVLPELKDNIDLLITDEDVTASKPDPQGYLLAASKLGAGKGEFVVVEDSLAGLEAGRRAGAFVLGIATTNSREVVEKMADMTIDEIGRIDAEQICNL